jgi:Kelch motif
MNEHVITLPKSAGRIIVAVLALFALAGMQTQWGANAAARRTAPLAYVEKAPEPVATERHASASVGNYLYIMGGEIAYTYNVTNTVQRYDPASDTWQFMASMPGVLDNSAACSMNGKIYVPGGWNGNLTTIFYIYDAATNSWTTGASIPTAYTQIATVVCDPGAGSAGKVHRIGGNNNNNTTNAHYVYDVATNSWTMAADLPAYTADSQGGLINGHIYVTGGNQFPGPISTTYDYNIATNTWTTRASMNIGCMDAAYGVDPNGRLWVAGGAFCTNGIPPTNRTERYDPVANTWTTMDPLNEAVYYTGGGFAGSLGGSALFHVVGGHSVTQPIPNNQQLAVPLEGTPTPTVTGTPPTSTPTLTPSPTSCVTNYNYKVAAGATVVPGTTNANINCDDCFLPIALPFPFTLYDRSYTSINISSNGTASFTSTASNFSNECLPSTTFTTYTISPFWDDQFTQDSANGEGVWYSTSGSAPNRVFNIEWRTVYCCTGGPPINDYELRLYEGQTRFDVIYGNPMSDRSSSTIGVQKDTTTYTQYICNTAGPTTGTMLAFTLAQCAQGTSTPTPATLTATAVPPTNTPLPVSTNTSTPVPPTATPTPNPNPPDFSLSVTPTSQHVVRPNSTSYTVNLSSVNGFGGSVNLSVSGLPSKTTGSFSPNPVTLTPGGNGSSVLSISTQRNGPTGTFTLTITGTGGGLSHSQNVTLTISR